ncbi:MAG: DUF6089 family protein [Chitinophagales bacterium]
MTATIRIIIVLTLIFNECLTLHAQQFVVSKYELGVGAGVFIYQGDLTPSRLGSYRTLKPAFNMDVNRMISPLLSLRTNLAFGGLKGDDAKYASPAYRQQRNFNFKTPVFELSELIVADLLRSNGSIHSFGISPYIFTGLGFSVLKIKRDYSHFNGEYFAAETSTIQGLATDAQHSLPKIIPVIPIGIGIKYPLSQKFMIRAETSYRFTFTDYLDGFSKAANAARKDSYQTNTIGIIYRFVTNDTMKCPVF